jgi:molybdopterin/thiamine biosynthesis adenylyltransferase
MMFTRTDLEAISFPAEGLDGQMRQVLGLLQARELSRTFRLPLWEVERQALEWGIPPHRYERNLATFGVEGQLKLLSARVAVVGLGGLGGWVAEVLARAGVGFLRLIDGDQFVETNLNRQLFSSVRNLGQNKAKAAKRHLHGVNPGIRLEDNPVFLDDKNADLLLGDMDIVVDALGDLTNRALLYRHASRLKRTVVHGALGGLFGQLALIEPGRPGLEQAYGPLEELPAHGQELYLGTPSPTPAVLGALQAQVVLQVLLGQVETLRGALFFLDLDHFQWTRVAL